MSSRLPRCAALLAAILATAPLAAEETCTTYGVGVSLDTATAAADILAAPAAWKDKEVRIDGTVREVCSMAGCWVEIVAGEDGSASPLKVKVEDGKIVFPVSSRGARARAQGRVEFSEWTRGRWVSLQKHLAEEAGKPFDESTIGDGPYHFVQVKGTGAVLCQ